MAKQSHSPLDRMDYLLVADVVHELPFEGSASALCGVTVDSGTLHTFNTLMMAELDADEDDDYGYTEFERCRQCTSKQKHDRMSYADQRARNRFAKRRKRFGEPLWALVDGRVAHVVDTKPDFDAPITARCGAAGSGEDVKDATIAPAYFCPRCISGLAKTQTNVQWANFRFAARCALGLFVLGSVLASFASPNGVGAVLDGGPNQTYPPFWKTEIWVAIASGLVASAVLLHRSALGDAQLRLSKGPAGLFSVLALGSVAAVVWLHGVGSDLDGFLGSTNQPELTELEVEDVATEALDSDLYAVEGYGDISEDRDRTATVHSGRKTGRLCAYGWEADPDTGRPGERFRICRDVEWSAERGTYVAVSPPGYGY